MNSPEQTAQDLDRLEEQIGELLKRLKVLDEENRSLHARQETLVAERAKLVARNEEARTRVEAMIGRLKSLEGSG